jgi:hypothetical protein
LPQSPFAKDELRVRQILFKVEGVDRIEDDVGLAADDQHGHLDVLQIGKTFSDRLSSFLKSSKLCRLHLFTDDGIAVLRAEVPALHERSSGSLTLKRRSKETIDPEVVEISRTCS